MLHGFAQYNNVTNSFLNSLKHVFKCLYSVLLIYMSKETLIGNYNILYRNDKSVKIIEMVVMRANSPSPGSIKIVTSISRTFLICSLVRLNNLRLLSFHFKIMGTSSLRWRLCNGRLSGWREIKTNSTDCLS